MPVIVPQRRVWTRQPPSETGGSQGVLFAFNPAVWAKEQIVGTALTQRHGSLFAYKRAKTHLCADLTAHAAAGLLASNLGHRAGVHFCTPSTFVFAIRPTTADGCFFSRYAAVATTSGYAGAFKIGRSGTSVVVNYNDGSGAMQTWTIAANVVSDKDTVIAIDVQRDKLVCYKDGKYVAETAWTMPELGASLVPNVSLPLTIGGEGNGVHSGFKGYVYGIGVVTDGEPRSLSENPWQIFKPRRRITYIDLGAPAAATLEGHAQAQASATGNLTLAATLDGAALSVATATGTLTTQIPLAGAAVSVVSAAGELLTGIPLSGAAVAQAVAAGSLTAQIRLDGNALAQAAASAGLTSAILLAGNAQGQATATGALAGESSGLAGDAKAEAAAVATLTTSIRLSGSAAAQAGVSGILTTQIQLTGAALAEAIATGVLSEQIYLAGDAKSSASASGILAGTTVRPVLDDRFQSLIASREWRAVAEPREFLVASVGRKWEATL